MPIEFIHSDTGSIRCPLHNQRESFTAGHIIQPMDSRQVRYPCGYVDGLASASPSIEPALPVLRRDELLAELVNRLKRLEERPYTRPRPMPTPGVEPTASKEPSILTEYGSEKSNQPK